MGFLYWNNVSEDHRLLPAQKETALSNTIIFIYEYWRQQVIRSLETQDITYLYSSTVYKNKAIDVLMSEDILPFGRA